MLDNFFILFPIHLIIYQLLMQIFKAQSGFFRNSIGFFLNEKYALKHLKARLIEAKYINQDTDLTIDVVKDLLNERFDNIDYKDAKKDVFPFISDQRKIELWSANFFKAISEKLEGDK